MNERLRTLLAHPRGHWITVVFALLFTIPCIGQRLVLDDHVLALQMRDDPGIAGFRSRPLDLFTFTDGDPANNHALVDEGALLPWWSHPQLRVAFFRPLACATHVIDFALFADHPAWMYVHSLLWWAALLFGLAHIYHRFHGHTVFAGFALLLYAIDDVHGATLSWISNRNAVIATVLALPALGALHRARTQSWKPGYVIGPACFALALCAGETAIGLCAYLFAYAVVVDQGPWKQRLLAMAPYVALVIAWRVAYQAYGYGSFGSDAYHDPGREPLAFLHAAGINLPILLASMLGAGTPFADLYAWGPPEMAFGIIVSCVIAIAIYVAILWPVWRTDRLARFWSLGSLVALLPSAASVPGERLLLFATVGAAPVFVSAFQYWWQQRVLQRTVVRTLVMFILIASHLFFAPIGLVLRSGALQNLGAIIDRTDDSLGHDAALVDDHLIVINPPYDVMVSYLQVARQARHEVRPAHFQWLAPASSKLRVTVTTESTLRIQPERGFVMSVTERHYNNEPERLVVGHTIALTGLHVTVVETTADHRPAVVDFTFDRPLNARGLRLLQWDGRHLVPFVAPAVGGSVELPADGFFPTLLRDALTMTP